MSTIVFNSQPPIVNINNPGTPTTTPFWATYNVKPSQLEELTSRSVIYSKFRIRSVEYTFKRDKITNPQCIATAEYSQANWAYAFPNQFNRLLPVTTSTNTTAICNWLEQQTGRKRIAISKDSFVMKIKKVKMIENTDYQGPSGVAAGASAVVNKQTACPWLDMNSDLTDDLSLGQVHFFQPPMAVTTTMALATAAGGVGPTIQDIINMFNYKVTARVHFSVKGRWLDKAVI